MPLQNFMLHVNLFSWYVFIYKIFFEKKIIVCVDPCLIVRRRLLPQMCRVKSSCKEINIITVKNLI